MKWRVKAASTPMCLRARCADAELMKGKKILIIDDVISTGESLAATRELVKQAGAIEAAACAFLAEGDAANRDDIIFLEKLPLFFK